MTTPAPLPPVADEQLRYARWLDWGAKAGFAALVVGWVVTRDDEYVASPDGGDRPAAEPDSGGAPANRGDAPPPAWPADVPGLLGQQRRPRG